MYGSGNQMSQSVLWHFSYYVIVNKAEVKSLFPL